MKMKLTAKQAREIKEQLTDRVRFTYPGFNSWDKDRLITYTVSGDINNKDEVSAIYKVIGSMIVEKVTNQFIHLYSFDMVGNKTTAKMDLSLINII